MRVIHPGALCVIVLAFATRNCSPDDTAVRYVVQVDAGDHERHATPIVVELPAEVIGFEDFELRSADTPRPLPLQRLPGETSRAIFVLREPLAAGESRSYRLQASAAPAVEPNDSTHKPALRCMPTELGLRIDFHGNPVVHYNVAVVEPPAGIEGLFRRSGHMHPVATPGGRIVTEQFPEDKGKKDKGKREQQKKAQLTTKEKRKLKKEKKNK